MADVAEKLSLDPYLGTTIDGEFRIEEKVGSGGMGNVYRAVQQLTERSVAIKILHAHLCDDAMTARFLQEAQITSRLSHPNIVTVHKYGQHTDGTLYIAMEYVQGRGLHAVLESGRAMDLERALPLMIPMADALAHAHEEKVVHRDIKPENIVVTRTGRTESIKILDFGIAKLVDGNAVLTKSGVLCGSPPYMAPEQWQQVRDLDGRTDIYALGCVFYELITGRQPFRADSVVGFMRAHVEEPPPPSPLEAGARLEALPELGDIIMRCLQRDRTARFTDAYALVEALREAQLHFEASRRARRTPLSVARDETERVERAVALTQIAQIDTSQPCPASEAAAWADPPANSVRLRSPPAADEGQPPEESAPADDTRLKLRAVAQAFSAREALASSTGSEPADPHAARTHLLLVATGGVLCTALALALILLR